MRQRAATTLLFLLAALGLVGLHVFILPAPPPAAADVVSSGATRSVQVAGLVTLAGDQTLAGTKTFSGKIVRAVQAVTVADDGAGSAAPFTLTPTGSYIEITCNDANGCTATLSETGAVEGHEFIAVNVSAANVVNFADSAGVSELAGAFAAGTQDALRLVYTGAAWVEADRSDN